MANTAPKASTGSYTCPSCGKDGFTRQMEMFNHALPCKRGELNEQTQQPSE